MHMNLWSYNKRKLGDTICTPPPTGNGNSFKIQKEKEGGRRREKLSERLQRGFQ
jgi:hypothetical protein